MCLEEQFFGTSIRAASFLNLSTGGICIALLFSTMVKHALEILQFGWLQFVVLGVFLATPLSVKGAAAPDADNRKLVSKAVNALVLAWNKQDADVIAEYFLPDAVLVMPTGKVARTRAAIRERLLAEWNGKLKDSVLSHAVESVSLEGKDTALVKGKYRLEGVKVLGFERSPEGAFVFSHRKQQGRWMIAKAELLRNAAAAPSGAAAQ